MFGSVQLATRASVTVLAMAASAVAPAAGEGVNVTWLGSYGFSSWHSDIWGYASGGTEIAIIGGLEGTAFVDVTDPTDPTPIFFLPGVQTIWREYASYQNYIYCVNDNNFGSPGDGMLIVDMSDPLDPVLVNTVTTFQKAHTIRIDESAGLLFANGADIESGSKCHIFSLADPEHPLLLDTYTDRYVHDSYSRDGIAYMAEIYDGTLATVDLTPLPGPLTVLDRITTSEAFTHSAWLTDDSQYCLTTDEVSGAAVDIIDVSDPGNLSAVASWHLPEDPTAIPHNVHVKGDYAYVAWYTAGLQILDISDPTNPVRAGYYDTFPGGGGIYDGAWGVYPYAPSGNLYVGDITSGLVVLRFDSALPVPETGPVASGLLPPSPNPFRAGSVLRFELAEPGRAMLEIFDVRGRLVRRLLDENLPVGAHSASWDGQDRMGGEVATGAYLARLRTPGREQTVTVIRTR